MKKLTTFAGSVTSLWTGINRLFCCIYQTTKISLHLGAFRKMVENDECVICKCNQEKAQIALFGQSGQFKSSEPLVIRPNWFKKVKKAISKKARRFLTK